MVGHYCHDYQYMYRLYMFASSLSRLSLVPGFSYQSGFPIKVVHGAKIFLPLS